MRNIFAETLYSFAKKNKKIHVVAADISPAGSMETFRKKYPNRFINTGVAEQVMIGVAAGLAMRQQITFAYTIATFSLYRPFEMIRDDICYQKLPVTIVGMGAGSIYANLGGTHLTQEDISIAKSIPNMQVLAPCDPLELKNAVKFCCTKNKGPLYLRIGKSGEKNFTSKAIEKWQFGKIRKITNGSKICFMSYGPIIKKAFEINNQLKKYNIKSSIYSCHTLKPLDKIRIKKILKKYKIICVIEDHSEIGSLTNEIKNLSYDLNINPKILSYCLKDQFIHSYYDQETLLNKHGITNSKIIKDIISYKKKLSNF